MRRVSLMLRDPALPDMSTLVASSRWVTARLIGTGWFLAIVSSRSKSCHAASVASVEGPCIAGHEYAGRVVALGDGAADRHGVVLGDRVVAEQIVPCGECRFC